MRSDEMRALADDQQGRYSEVRHALREAADRIDALEGALRATANELDRHGHGDHHYTEQGWRDPKVVAALVHARAVLAPRVAPAGECVTCGGSGKWRGQDGYDRKGCLACGGTGVVPEVPGVANEPEAT